MGLERRIDPRLEAAPDLVHGVLEAPVCFLRDDVEGEVCEPVGELKRIGPGEGHRHRCRAFRDDRHGPFDGKMLGDRAGDALRLREAPLPPDPADLVTIVLVGELGQPHHGPGVREAERAGGREILEGVLVVELLRQAREDTHGTAPRGSPKSITQPRRC